MLIKGEMSNCIGLVFCLVLMWADKSWNDERR